MKTKFLLGLFLSATLFSCGSSDDTDPAVTPESLYQEEGYVMASISQSTAGYSYYAGFFSDLPAGDVDLTKKAAYSTFSIRTSYKNFIFGSALTGDKKLSKQAILKSTGAIVEVAAIPLIDFISAVKIISDDLGIYTTGGNRAIFLFNPTTMENLGQIDMTAAQNFPANETNIYTHLAYRKSDNRLFATLFTNSSKTGQFYDSENVYVEVINLTTKKWEKTAMFPQATYPVSRGSENGLVDEQGNVYIVTQGQYGLDGQLGPNSAKRSKPQILKIPAGSTDFDLTYSFNPVTAIGMPNLLFQLVLGTIYDSNGIVYACISGQQDPPRLLELIAKLANQTITATEYSELSNLAFYGPNQRWVKLNMNTQTATLIADIPLTAGYAYPNTKVYDGKFYLPVYNPDLKLNGIYKYDPLTSKSEKINTVTAGGLVTDFVKFTK